MRSGVFCVIVAVCAVSVLGEDTYWQADASGGSWYDEANWSAGVPGSEDDAFVSGEGEARITSGFAEMQRLHLGTSGPGSIVQSGGLVSVRWHADIGYPYGGFTQTLSESNVGSYRLEGGDFSSGSLSITSAGSVFEQIGGRCSIVNQLVVRGPQAISGMIESAATYDLIGGQLAASRVQVGGGSWGSGDWGYGLFRQIGGVHTVADTLHVGGSYAQSWFIALPDDGIPDLIVPISGEPETSVSSLATSLGSRSDFDASVVTNLYIPPARPSQGKYELGGGVLDSGKLVIDRTGSFVQTGGVHNTQYIDFTPASRYSSYWGPCYVNSEEFSFDPSVPSASQAGRVYAMSGGSLDIAHGVDMHNDSQFDLKGAAVSITAGGLVNFSRGSLINSDNASLSMRANSLVILPAGFDPQTQFGSFSSEGLVHWAGSDLVVASTEGFSGWGRIDDHVINSGTISTPDGGNLDLDSGLMLEEGAVDLGGGKLNVTNNRSGINSGSLATGEMTVGREFFSLYGSSEPSVFGHSGGEVTVAGQLAVGGDGSYDLSGGKLSAGRLSVGSNGCSRFTQTGGICEVEGMFAIEERSLCMVMCGSEINVSTDVFGDAVFIPINQPEPSAIYTITGGSFKAGSMTIMDIGGTSQFIQTGGVVQCESELSLYSNCGYTMYGGQLRVDTMRVSRWGYGSDSLFALLSPSVDVCISSELVLNDGATLVTVPGASIDMAAGSFKNLSADEQALAGLGNLTLVFTGDESSQATFEVAGADLGDGLAGFFDNFVLDTLQVGDDSAGWLQLVDDFVNQVDCDGAEALYVKNLILTDGSTLDLNGLNLYCLNSDIDSGALIIGGAIMSADAENIPEPVSLAVLTLSLPALFRSRRRRIRSN